METSGLQWLLLKWRKGILNQSHISTAVTRALCPLFATKAIPGIFLVHLCERHLRDLGQEPYLNCVHHTLSCSHDLPGWKGCVNDQAASSCKKRPSKEALRLPLISMSCAAHLDHNILCLTSISWEYYRFAFFLELYCPLLCLTFYILPLPSCHKQKWTVVVHWPLQLLKRSLYFNKQYIITQYPLGRKKQHANNSCVRDLWFNNNLVHLCMWEWVGGRCFYIADNPSYQLKNHY